MSLLKIHFSTTIFGSAVSWNKNGSRIYVGTSKGYLYVVDSETLKVCVYQNRCFWMTSNDGGWDDIGGLFYKSD